MSRSRLALAVSTLSMGTLVAVLLVAAGRTTPFGVGVRRGGCDDLLAWLRRATLRHVTAYGMDTGSPWTYSGDPIRVDPSRSGGPAWPAPVPMPPAIPGPGASETNVQGPGNVQEHGVDEPDLVDTDGRVLVAVAGDTIRVFDVAGPTPVLRATIPIGPIPGDHAAVPWPGSGEHALVLHDDRLLVISSTWGTERLPPPSKHLPGIEQPTLLPLHTTTGDTRLTLFDLSDPANPRRVATTLIDGDLADARMVDGVLRLMVRYGPVLSLVAAQGRDAEQTALAVNREAVQRAPLRAWLPSLSHHNGAVRQRGLAVDCDQVFHPPEGDAGLATVTVLTFAVDDEDLLPEDSMAVVADTATVQTR